MRSTTPARLVPNKPEPGAPGPNGGVNPFVRQLGLQEVLQRDEPPPPETQHIDDESTWPALASHVRQAWTRNKLAKERVDRSLLADLRARRGVYSSSEIADIQNTTGGMNIVWSPLTETKCRAGSAWIRDVIMPVGEPPSGLEPTPVADLPLPMKRAIVTKAIQGAQQVMQQTAAAGGGVLGADEFKDLARQLGDKLRKDAEKLIQKMADERAKRMERVIEDRKVEGNFYPAMDEFVEDFTTFSAAIIKGPIYKRSTTLKWGAGWRPEVSNSAVQWWDRRSPFDIYPAPGAADCQQGDLLDRERYQRSELYDLKGLDGFHDDEIDKALEDYSAGHMEAWLFTEAERQRLEQETSYMWLSPPGVIDCLNYWGRVPGWKLMSWGVKGITDETRDYECNVLLCGRYVLYAALNPNPLGRRPYRKACYDAIPGAFWGRSVPNLARTSQKMCNGAAMAMADNMAMASGPQQWTHVDRLADGEQSMEVFPWKNWQLKSDPTQGTNPGVGFFQPDDNTGPLWTLHEKWELKADDSTGIPRYTYGNEHVGGAGSTATGLNTLMSNAAKGLRRGISNIDMYVIEPSTYDCFVNEMLYNPDQSIKGDCRVVPRGAAAILIRDQAQARRIQFLGLTANEFDMQIVGGKYRAALLREVAAALELPVDEVVPDEDALAQMETQRAQAQQAQVAALADEQQKEFQRDIVLTQVKEQAIAAREQASRTNEIIAGIVNQAVEASMAKYTEAAKPKESAPAEAKAPKKLQHTYDEKGNLVTSTLE